MRSAVGLRSVCITAPSVSGPRRQAEAEMAAPVSDPWPEEARKHPVHFTPLNREEPGSQHHSALATPCDHARWPQRRAAVSDRWIKSLAAVKLHLAL